MKLNCNTGAPTGVPTSVPADVPTSAPADVPTSAPADVPTSAPADVPTSAPADVPTSVPADVPAGASNPSDVAAASQPGVEGGQVQGGAPEPTLNTTPPENASLSSAAPRGYEISSSVSQASDSGNYVNGEPDAGTSGSSGTPRYVTVEELNKANPDASTDGFCLKAEFKEECRTNAQAVAAINKAIDKYKITRRGEVVAATAYMLLESGNWGYNINHWPGRAGQGTRTMMMFPFIAQYAEYLHSDEYAKIATGSIETASNETMNAVRQLVLNDEDSFAAGFWLMKVPYKDYFGNEDKLRDGNEEDFKNYILNAVKAGAYGDDRAKIWKAVNEAFTK
ncbi:hypothetical protein GGI07_000830 [Coemansia sp. Benny D115]|nr:hypothetical protein GGI07_000830 [Coemansia sp. Benny D115]